MEGRMPGNWRLLLFPTELRKLWEKSWYLIKKPKNIVHAKYGDIVILLRTASGWSETFTEVLSAHGIPVYAASKTGYFSALEVVTILNYLQVCDNPLRDHS